MRDFIVRVNPDKDETERIEVVEADSEEEAALDVISGDDDIAEVWVLSKTFQYRLNPTLTELPNVVTNQRVKK